jgi:hypothetical protein
LNYHILSGRDFDDNAEQFAIVLKFERRFINVGQVTLVVVNVAEVNLKRDDPRYPKSNLPLPLVLDANVLEIPDNCFSK